jgi:hypothetical protein
MVFLTSVLAACGSDECSSPRLGDELTCDSYDGGQLRFVVGEPLSDVSAFCASPCVDVYAPIAISGYEDLRTVPLLPKVRLVHKLGINIDTLRDLRGLEKVDVVRELSLSGQNGDTSRKTLEGLADEEMDAFSLEQVSGLANLEGSPVKRLNVFGAVSSSIQNIDLGGVQVTDVNVDGNDSLSSLRIPSAMMTQLRVRANTKLSELNWGPGLTVSRTLEVYANDALSSCLVQQLVEQTDAGVPRWEFISSNGPCP